MPAQRCSATLRGVPNAPLPRVLSIAGSDPSGGAGIQGDLKTFAAFGCHGMAVPAALTVQSTAGVQAVAAPLAGFTTASIHALLDDCPPAATKTGMLMNADVVASVADALAGGRGGALVVDPVLVSTSGAALLEEDAVALLRERLLPLATCVTPNLPEAEALTGVSATDGDSGSAWDAAAWIVDHGARACLVKGGHGPGWVCVDRLLVTGGARFEWTRPRLDVGRLHGTGCAFSAALAAGLARGLGIDVAARMAGDYVHAAIAGARPAGRGALCLDHAVRVPGMEPAR